MTIQDMQSFVEKVSEDDGLLGELRSTVSDNKEGNVPAALVALGARNGFTFTEHEAIQARDMIRGAGADGELTDDQLEMVAGGGWGSDANRFLRRTVSRTGREIDDFFSGW